jgi:hypothetical protein
MHIEEMEEGGGNGIHDKEVKGKNIVGSQFTFFVLSL